jgi:hypothetical protein
VGQPQALADVLARGKTRRSRAKVTSQINHIIKDPWVNRVIGVELAGASPPQHRLTWRIDPHARQDLEEEVFGKRVLITGRHDWPIAEIVAAYRSQAAAEFPFRQMKDPQVVSFSPMHHWTDHNIRVRVHVFACVLALQIACLMRRHAATNGIDMSVRELLDALADIQETVLIYPSTGGRPKARRMLTQDHLNPGPPQPRTTSTQDHLAEIFGLALRATRS